ncbi:hypothetical protein ACHAQA_004123 [Verticillium albo-atrum]
MLAWPAVSQLLGSIRPEIPNLHAVIQDHDPPIELLERQTIQRPLAEDGIESLTIDDRALLGLRVDAHRNPADIHLSDLDWPTVESLCKAYFETFNLIYPIVDRLTFNTSILSSVVESGFDKGVKSTLVCLIFALGAVALADSQNMPFVGYKGQMGVTSGGASDQPPGLAFFNEARKRLGFSMAECSLESIQVHALAGLYFESCSRHLEFWRSTISASMACHAFITTNPVELDSPRIEVIRRVFWHCSLMETYLNLELELPMTGLDKLDEKVGLPGFNGPYLEPDYMGNQDSQFLEYFASQVVLRQLSVGFHNTLRDGPIWSTLTLKVMGAKGQREGRPMTYARSGTRRPIQGRWEEGASVAQTGAVDGRAVQLAPGLPLSLSRPFASADLVSESVIETINHLAAQLVQWRNLLPTALRWEDIDALTFMAPSNNHYAQGSNLYPPALVRTMFTADMSSPLPPYLYATDVQVAMLRTRYYYTKSLIYRPAVYKALHHPNMLSTDDAEAVAECLKACLKWPIIMSPTCHRKRLIPCLFFWTQNVLGVLIILHLSQQVPVLTSIRTRFCGTNFDMEASETVNMCIAWIRDLKDADGTAEWCWGVLQGLYHLSD